MVYKNYKMGSFNLHTIKTDRFKNIRMEIHFHNNINPKTIARRTMLFELLLESSEFYPTKRDLVLKCEELYNASVYAKTNKVGNVVISSIIMDFLNPTYTDEDYLSDAISLPFELIFNPDLKDEVFNEEKLNIIKNRSLAEIASLKENPRNYSIHEVLKAMDKSSVSSLNLLGTEDDINQTNTSNIYLEYLNILEHDYVDVFVIGDIDEDKVVDLINKHQHFNTIKNHEIKMYVDNKVKKKKIKKDKSEYSQTFINYILNINNLTKKETLYTAHLFNHILGGSSLDTRLYSSLRGDNSLCYNIRSIYNKYDKLIIINTSVDPSNTKLACKLIDDAIKTMKHITEDELKKAKQAIITSINMSLDSPENIISNYLFNVIADLDLPEKRIEEYQSITIKDIENIMNKVNINTIHILEGNKEKTLEGNHEEN